MAKLYKYIGSESILLAVADYPVGVCILSMNDLKNWIVYTMQIPNAWGLIPATFVVDSEGHLRVADRHSEHIACAGGEPVLSAGEIFFFLLKRALKWLKLQINQQAIVQSQNLGLKLKMLLMNFHFFIQVILRLSLSFAYVLPVVK